MINKDLKYWELIIKENSEKLDSEERQMLDSWKNDNPSQYSEFINIYQSTSDQELPGFAPENEWEDLKTMIRIEEESQSGKSVRLLPWFARAAAAVFIIMGIVYLINYQTGSNDGLIMQTMVSTDGTMHKEVELPDGTIVWLNKNSEILYPEKFNLNTREVYLKGEAFFDVAHNKEKPFIVHAGISKTTVIGTSFNLRAYSKEDDIRLTVVSGKVAFTLSDDRERVLVTPGNIAHLNRNSKSITHGINTDFNFLSWKTNELKFNDCLISDLLPALERHFDIDIQVQNNQTNNCRFTGDFKDTNLDNALKIITSAIASSYQHTGDTYIILGEGCQ